MSSHNQLIFDVGMHNGDDSAYYLHRGFRVIAIEADPSLAAQGKIRFSREIADGRLVILNVGIAAERGTATFWICEGKSEWNSFNRGCAARLGRTAIPTSVTCLRFGDILREHGVPFYLKIDIEWNDKLCLADLDPANLPVYLSSELSDLRELQRLQSLGYDSFKLVWQGAQHRAVLDEAQSLEAWISRSLGPAALPLHWLLRKAKSLKRRGLKLREKIGRWSGERAADSWRFPLGSSGPFGEDAPGQWVSFEIAARRFQDVRRTRPQECWIDVHATRRAATGQLSAAFKAAA